MGFKFNVWLCPLLFNCRRPSFGQNGHIPHFLIFFSVIVFFVISKRIMPLLLMLIFFEVIHPLAKFQEARVVWRLTLVLAPYSVVLEKPKGGVP